ncbi:D-lyxose ketol-isomerase [Bradyrhizobium sp. LB9.1b]
MLIDSDPSSQLAAMQQSVGHPLPVFRSLVGHLNQTFSEGDWLIEVNPVTTKEEFWSVADRYKGHIAEVDLSFAVPNIWGGQSETEKALNELKNENNAQEVEVKIKNKDGQLNPDTERVRKSVDYITKGGGTVRLRDDTQNTIYSSENEENAVTTLVEPDFPVQQADVGMLTSLIQRLFKK